VASDKDEMVRWSHGGLRRRREAWPDGWNGLAGLSVSDWQRRGRNGMTTTDRDWVRASARPCFSTQPLNWRVFRGWVLLVHLLEMLLQVKQLEPTS
jgi:hypothetical protein